MNTTHEERIECQLVNLDDDGQATTRVQKEFLERLLNDADDLARLRERLGKLKMFPRYPDERSVEQCKAGVGRHVSRSDMVVSAADISALLGEE